MNKFPKLLAEKTIFRGDTFRINSAFIELPNGQRIVREIAERQSSVGIVAVDDQKKVLLIEEYQASVKRTVLGIVYGRLNGNERPLPAARRELREEVGYAASRWDPLFKTDGAKSWRWSRTFYLARRLKKNPLPKDDEEKIIIHRVSLRRAVQLGLAGKLNSADAIVALILAYQKVYRKKIV